MTTVEVESNKPSLQCRDCAFSTMSVQEFSDHIETCPVNPVSHPKEDRFFDPMETIYPPPLPKPEKEEGGEG